MTNKTKRGRASIIRQMVAHLDGLNAKIDEYERCGTMGGVKPVVFHFVGRKLARGGNDEISK